MNIVLKIITVTTLLTLTLFSNSIGVCKGCHGQQFEKSVQGKSKIVKNMTEGEIKSALVGYQNGTYGGVMKSVMQAQVQRLNSREIETLASAIKN